MTISEVVGNAVGAVEKGASAVGQAISNFVNGGAQRVVQEGEQIAQEAISVIEGPIGQGLLGVINQAIAVEQSPELAALMVADGIPQAQVTEIDNLALNVLTALKNRVVLAQQLASKASAVMDAAQQVSLSAGGAVTGGVSAGGDAGGGDAAASPSANVPASSAATASAVSETTPASTAATAEGQGAQ